MRLTFFLLLFLMSFSDVQSQKDDLGLKFFLQSEDVKGVMLFYDSKNKKYYASDNKEAKEKTLPGSTFKIFNTLLFLKLGIVKDTSHQLKWDGVERSFNDVLIPSWNKDTYLAEAFRNSTIWAYEKLSQDIALKEYNKLLKRHGYGSVTNRKKKNLDFWNTGSNLGYSPKSQIQFLIKLRNSKLKFEDEHMDMVKELMVEKQTDKYTIRSKTGMARSYRCRFCEDEDLGWYIGYVETDDNVYYFATRLEKYHVNKRRDFMQLRKDLTYKGLKHLFKLSIEK